MVHQYHPPILPMHPLHMERVGWVAARWWTPRPRSPACPTHSSPPPPVSLSPAVPAALGSARQRLKCGGGGWGSQLSATASLAKGAVWFWDNPRNRMDHVTLSSGQLGSLVAPSFHMFFLYWGRHLTGSWHAGLRTAERCMFSHIVCFRPQLSFCHGNIYA